MTTTFKSGDLVALDAPNGHYLGVVGSPAYTPRSGHLLIHLVPSWSGLPRPGTVRRHQDLAQSLGSTWKRATGQDFEPRRGGVGMRPAGRMEPSRIRALKQRAGLTGHVTARSQLAAGWRRRV